MNKAPLTHSKHIMALLALAVACPFAQAETAGYLSPSAAAGTSEFGYQSGINAREIARRQQQALEAKQLLQEGRTAYADRKYKDALDKYKAAWDVIPKAPATTAQQEFIIASIGDASIAVAMEYAKVGRYDDAEQLLLEVLGREPNNKRARKELSLLRDPVRNNPALTPEHVKNVEEVNRLLALAYGYYDLGQFDEAYSEFERVIRIDPYNTAARRGQEAVSKRRTSYYKTAHDTIRAQALADVSAAWIQNDHDAAPMAQFGSIAGSAAPISEATIKNSNNLDAIQIASVNFEDTHIDDALDFLRGEARKRGLNINFVFEAPQAAPIAAASADESDDDFGDDFGGDDFGDEEGSDSAAPTVVEQAVQEPIIKRLVLSNVTGKDLLQRVCDSAGCQYRVDDVGVIVTQKGAGAVAVFKQTWPNVPRDFFDTEDAESSDEEDPWATSSAPKAKIDAKATLINNGLTFPKGSSAHYSRTGSLTVYNTQENLDLVADAIDAYRRKQPQMVKVLAKFVEISQTNEEELSFDWVINPFSVSNTGDMYLGGVNGTNASTTRTTSDFVSSGGSGYSNNYTGNSSWPISSTTNSTDSISNGLATGSLRSGSGAITGDSLTSMLEAGSTQAGSTSSVAPGIMSLSGIFDSGSFQMIMRGLSQKKGVDIMSAPSLVARGGHMEYTPEPDELLPNSSDDDDCAKIEVVRRFLYPSFYSAPTVADGGGGDDSTSYPVATSANPEEWAVEEVGIILRFRVADELESSDVIKFEHFEIRVVDFEGFINYGTPITSAVSTQDSVEQVLLTENRIDMPIFQRRYINSNPCIYDGHTIAIGGLIEDEVQKVEDKVPVLGDIPFIGRLFRSEAESHIQKNLMVFVTAEKIDPTGTPIRKRDEGSSDAPTSGTGIPSLFPEDGLANP